MTHPRFWNLFCLILLALLLSRPSLASDDGITDISITSIPPLTGQPVNHELSFVATRELASAQVQVEYPSDFYLNHVTNRSKVGQTIVFSVQRAIAAGERVTLRADGIINPTIPETYTLQVSTSGDTAKVPKQLSVKATAGAVTEAWMDSTNLLPGATSSHEVNFSATNELPAGGTVRVEYPAGFVLSGATLAESDAFALQEVSGQVIVYRALRNFPAGQHFWDVLRTGGIINPTASGSHLLKLSTSSDPAPVYLPYVVRNGGTVRGAMIFVSSVTAGKPSSYTFSFTPGTGLPEGATVMLEFPEGYAPAVENSSDGQYAVESVSGQMVTLRMLKPVDALVYRPMTLFHGPENSAAVTISARNVANPSVAGSYVFNIWTSNDTTKTPLPVFINRPMLSVSFAGSGGGSVNGGYSCLSPGVCSFTPMSREVTLIATPDADSLFAGWSGACTAASSDCEVVVDSNRQVTATFHLADRVRFLGRPYATLAAAFAESASGTIEARATEFTETVIVTSSTRLKGGFDRQFASNQGGFSVLKGSLTIGAGGSLLAEGLVIR